MSRTSRASEIKSSFSFAKALRVLPALALWPGRVLEVLRQSRQLVRLDESMLKDIGLSKADAYREWSRAFWDLPGDLGGRERHSLRGRSC